MTPTTQSYESPTAPTPPPAAPKPRGGGKSFALGALVVLNALLAVVFFNRQTPDQTAHAQAARPSDYLMIPGTVTGVSTGIIFVVDTSSGQLSAFTYNDTRDALVPLPKIDLNQVFKAGASVGGAGGVGKPPKIR